MAKLGESGSPIFWGWHMGRSLLAEVQPTYKSWISWTWLTEAGKGNLERLGPSPNTKIRDFNLGEKNCVVNVSWF